MLDGLKRGWARFWALPWKWKGPILAIVGLVIIGAAVPSEEQESKDGAASRTTTASPVNPTTASPTSAKEPTPAQGAGSGRVYPTAAGQVEVTPDPNRPLAERVEQSIRDNQKWVKNGADLSGLVVNFKDEEAKIVISITPKKPTSLPGYLTAGSAMAVVAGKAIWDTYPEVNLVEVYVARESTTTTNVKGQAWATYALYSRASSSRFNWEKLKTQPQDDNKRMYCDADFYDVAFDIWYDLKDKGCMTAFAGGLNRESGVFGPVYEQLPPLGVPVELREDGWILTVTGVSLRKTIDTYLGLKTALGVYLVIDFKMENISNKTQSLCGDRFTIYDDRGRKYPYYLDGTVGVDALELCSRINAGLSAPARIVFDVPPDATGLIFTSLGGFKVRLGNVANIQ